VAILQKSAEKLAIRLTNICPPFLVEIIPAPPPQRKLKTHLWFSKIHFFLFFFTTFFVAFIIIIFFFAWNAFYLKKEYIINFLVLRWILIHKEKNFSHLKRNNSTHSSEIICFDEMTLQKKLTFIGEKVTSNEKKKKKMRGFSYSKK